MAGGHDAHIVGAIPALACAVRTWLRSAAAADRVAEGPGVGIGDAGLLAAVAAPPRWIGRIGVRIAGDAAAAAAADRVGRIAVGVPGLGLVLGLAGRVAARAAAVAGIVGMAARVGVGDTGIGASLRAG